jgi:hypothetical protein
MVSTDERVLEAVCKVGFVIGAGRILRAKHFGERLFSGNEAVFLPPCPQAAPRTTNFQNSLLGIAPPVRQNESAIDKFALCGASQFNERSL